MAMKHFLSIFAITVLFVPQEFQSVILMGRVSETQTILTQY